MTTSGIHKLRTSFPCSAYPAASFNKRGFSWVVARTRPVLPFLAVGRVQGTILTLCQPWAQGG